MNLIPAWVQMMMEHLPTHEHIKVLFCPSTKKRLSQLEDLAEQTELFKKMLSAKDLISSGLSAAYILKTVSVLCPQVTYPSLSELSLGLGYMHNYANRVYFR